MSNQITSRQYQNGKLVKGELPIATIPTRPQNFEFEDESEPSAPAPAPSRDENEITDTAQMRGFLLKQMVLAAKGELDTERVKNVCALAQQVYHATKLELEAARISKDTERYIKALELTGDAK